MSAFHELMILEALKLVDEKPNVSELKQAFAEAETELNPSGGTLAANPLTGAGLAAVAAAARHIRQDSTETRGVAHSTGGFTDQVQAVTVLEGE
jgi:acetyl-CoA acetyltransferase